MPRIEDIATGVQLTVMDDTVVVEDTPVAQTISLIYPQLLMM